MGSSESRGETSPTSDLKGAPKRFRAVGELSSDTSYLTCSAMSSRLRSGRRTRQSARLQKAPGGGKRTVLLLARQGLPRWWLSSWRGLFFGRGHRGGGYVSHGCNRSAALGQLASFWRSHWRVVSLGVSGSSSAVYGMMRGSMSKELCDRPKERGRSRCGRGGGRGKKQVEEKLRMDGVGVCVVMDARD
jgi:hypothetical protein